MVDQTSAGEGLHSVPFLSHDGRLPFQIRIGVTGHRDINVEPAIQTCLDQTLDRIRVLCSSPYIQPIFVVISPLAEGADRLVARRILETPMGSLEAILPFPQETYVLDFTSEQSKGEFNKLLSQAREVTVIEPTQSREEAYEGAGRRLVDRCDVLIALWDGEPSRGRGSTAEIVEYSQQRNKPIFWVVTKGQPEVREIGTHGLLSQAFRQTELYNRASISQRLFDKEVAGREQALRITEERFGSQPPGIEANSKWFLPFYVRADLLASRYQSWYYFIGTSIFLIAAAAIAIIVILGLLVHQLGLFLWVELGLGLVLLLLLQTGQQNRMHDRWVSRRFLAERFRSAQFLALAGRRTQRAADFGSAYLGQSSEEWLHRAFLTVWNERPVIALNESNVPDLSNFLAEAWIEDQRTFYKRAGKRSNSRHLWLGRTIGVLFAPIVITLVLTGTNVIQNKTFDPLAWPNVLTIASVILAALGATLTGVRAQREYRRIGQRFSQLEHYMLWLKSEMIKASNLDSIRRVAAEVEEALLEENRDWFLAMRFHGFEL